MIYIFRGDALVSARIPGIEDGAVVQTAVEMVAHEVRAHHRALAVFGSADGFGGNQVGFVPHIQQMDGKHQGGIWRNHFTCEHGWTRVRWRLESKDTSG